MIYYTILATLPAHQLTQLVLMRGSAAFSTSLEQITLHLC